jgi:sulfate permease, SulP family
MRRALRGRPAAPKLIVLEASNIVEIDFSAAQILRAFIDDCREQKIAVAVARLESVRAPASDQRRARPDALVSQRRRSDKDAGKKAE